MRSPVLLGLREQAKKAERRESRLRADVDKITQEAREEERVKALADAEETVRRSAKELRKKEIAMERAIEDKQRAATADTERRLKIMTDNLAIAKRDLAKEKEALRTLREEQKLADQRGAIDRRLLGRDMAAALGSVTDLYCMLADHSDIGGGELGVEAHKLMTATDALQYELKRLFVEDAMVIEMVAS